MNRYRRIVRRIRAIFEEGVRQQVTLSGLLFTAVMTMVGLAAFASANNLLFLLFAALLGTMLISGLVSRLGLAGLELDVDLPEHVAARRKIVGRVLLRNMKWTPSFSIHLHGGKTSGFSSELYFPILPARSRTVEPVEIEFSRRGLYRESEFVFSSRFPFGFTERRAHITLEREIVVYPCIDAQHAFAAMLDSLAGELDSLQRGAGHDFYRIRPYEFNESARNVDWRATAHTGDLQIREFAREQDPALTVFLDLNVPRSAQQEFDNAVDCAAFLLWNLSQSGSRVRLLTHQFDRTAPEEADIYAMLRYLALVEPAPGPVPPPPDAEREIYVALTADPARLNDAGWIDDRVFALCSLAPVQPTNRQ